jgi:hypothetical protein
MAEQQRERREREAAASRRKEKHEVNANASPEVKQRLQVDKHFISFIIDQICNESFGFSLL